jgi:hypothetical protein
MLADQFRATSLVIDNGVDTDTSRLTLPRLTDLHSQPLNGPIAFDGTNGLVLRYRLTCQFFPLQFFVLLTWLMTKLFLVGSPYMRVDVISANATLFNEGPSPTAQQMMPDIGANFTFSKGTFMGANLIGMIPTSNTTLVPRTVLVIISHDCMDLNESQI